MNIKTYAGSAPSGKFITPTAFSTYLPDFSESDLPLLENYIVNNFGERIILKKFYFNDELISQGEINEVCDNVVATMAYSYNGLLATTKFNYVPIENYNMVETGNDKIIHDTEDVHDISNTDTLGAQLQAQTDDFPVTQETVRSQTAPYESENYVNQNLTTTDNIAKTEKHSLNISEVINKNSATDITSRTGSDTTEHSLNRSGNIGVTTTQQMIQQEREVLKFNLFSIISRDIINKITYNIWKGEL